VGANAFSGCNNLTIYTERTSNPNWGGITVWNVTLSPSKNFVVSFVKTVQILNARNPSRADHSFGGWLHTNGITYSTIADAPNGTLTAIWNASSCIAEGTLITLADGSQVAVESLTGNELLLVWNHHTGDFDVAPILFIDSDPLKAYEIIHLFFSDGTDVKVIYEHAFWNTTLNRYVFFRDNENIEYIGHWFVRHTTDTYGNLVRSNVQLIDVQIYTEYTTAWSPVTFSHLNFFVNGMLSMPGATEGLINIFAVDANTLQFNQAQYLADIQTYGLFEYTDFEHLIPIEVFIGFNVQYLSVSLGKGLITWERIEWLIGYYGGFWG
jgi:hypothetical protein